MMNIGTLVKTFNINGILPLVPLKADHARDQVVNRKIISKYVLNKSTGLLCLVEFILRNERVKMENHMIPFRDQCLNVTVVRKYTERTKKIYRKLRTSDKI